MVKYSKVEMTDEDMRDKKLHLAYCKNQRDESDLNLLEMEQHLETDLANRLLDDDIKKLQEDIDKGVILDNFGKKVDATDTDLDRMKIALNKFKKQKELDLPSRQLRLNINKLRDAKLRPDAPEKQIKKLEKEIRERSYEIVAKEETTTYHD